jgi:hypothetical protein
MQRSVGIWKTELRARAPQIQRVGCAGRSIFARDAMLARHFVIAGLDVMRLSRDPPITPRCNDDNRIVLPSCS